MSAVFNLTFDLAAQTTNRESKTYSDAIFAGVKSNLLRWEDQVIKENAGGPPPLDPEV